MTEAEIAEPMTMMMDLTLSAVSVFFIIVSAYTVALFYFLWRASIGLKITACGFFTLTLIFITIFADNSFNDSAAPREALDALGAAQDLSAAGEKAIGAGVSGRRELDELIRGMMWLGMGLGFATLTYFTFIHRWPPAAVERGRS